MPTATAVGGQVVGLARGFPREKAEPFAAEWDRTSHFPRDVIDEFAQLVDHVAREVAGAIPLGGERLGLLAREPPRQPDDLPADGRRGRHRTPGPSSRPTVLWPPLARAAGPAGTSARRARPEAPS